MASFSRRQMIQGSLFGLATAGVGGLTLRAGAFPTLATEDVHDYQTYLDDKGIPQVQPAEKWEPTGKDVLGPYFVAGAPFRGKVTAPLVPGETLVMRGRVWGYDTKKPLAQAVLDVWQADHEGNYDMDDPANPPAWEKFRNRIRLVTDEMGYYEYETIKPAAYGVGRGTRPSHIHYMVQAPGYKKLVTQVYFKGDPHLKSDASASRSNLIIQPEVIATDGGKYLRGTFDIVLAQ
jgi:protocatechuate 3,4-dioxygenase beta subunit